MHRTKSSRRSLALFVQLTMPLLAGASQEARADEGGVPFWFSGQYASFAAVPATPGWSMPVQGYYYSGGVEGGKELRRGNVATAGLDTTVALLMAQPTYAPETKLLGGQLSFGLGYGWGNNTTHADL